MKKTLLLILTFLMVITMSFGCNGNNPSNGSENPDNGKGSQETVLPEDDSDESNDDTDSDSSTDSDTDSDTGTGDNSDNSSGDTSDDEQEDEYAPNF